MEDGRQQVLRLAHFHMPDTVRIGALSSTVGQAAVRTRPSPRAFDFASVTFAASMTNLAERGSTGYDMQ